MKPPCNTQKSKWKQIHHGKYTEKKPPSLNSYHGLDPRCAAPNEIRWKYTSHLLK